MATVSWPEEEAMAPTAQAPNVTLHCSADCITATTTDSAQAPGARRPTRVSCAPALQLVERRRLSAVDAVDPLVERFGELALVLV